MKVGQRVIAERVFSQSDFDRFATLSGDDNPIHVDPEFSAGTRFGRPVCHGMLLFSTICGLLGSRLPGPGMVQLQQTLMFPTPTFAGETVFIQVDVVDLQQADRLAVLDTTISRPNGDQACQGQAVVTTEPRQLGKWQPEKSGGNTSGARTMKGLRLGQQATLSRTYTSADLAEYADLTGDANPIYHDAAYARAAGFDGPLIPGGLLGGLFSTLLGTTLPGRGTNWLKQRLQFLRPAYTGQSIIATVEIVRLRPDKELVNLQTRCKNQDSEVICTGEALVLVSDLMTDTSRSLW